ncbi:HD-hydrolase domain [Acidisarcina polymorpha]|uniref:HD-hydrolase domain n=1 Tax=Acidisarcina polymorpha TaxID=2211140 RepID=A0A2Z5G3L5_9BACT|nr:HD domain-containing phosphohydrolase [Acidisarcina polymorpha]AXC13659.1 HD-hydrolase domain [Acidisarcina polymorpha]
MPAKRIVIIDDEASSGHKTGSLLEDAGYIPVFVRASSEALQNLNGKVVFDALILDIKGNGALGLELLRRILQLYPDSAVVVISALEDIRVAITAIKAGAYDYLLKPLRTEELLNTVQAAVEHREHGRQLTQERQNLENLVAARTELLRRAITDLERSYDITLEALGNALDLKDAETEGHSKRVTAYAIVLARAMRIDPAEVKIIARGAYLHDIGKMAIPDAILSKPGKLDPAEQAIMREHCLRGYTILKKIPFLEKASEIVFSHQEHFDGSGYSRGLKGEEIPLGARIFAVADALDAITSDRPYRKAQPFANARREIERCSGTQFDPAIVRVFQSLPDQLWEDLRTEVNHPKMSIAVDVPETLRNR